MVVLAMSPVNCARKNDAKNVDKKRAIHLYTPEHGNIVIDGLLNYGEARLMGQSSLNPNVRE